MLPSVISKVTPAVVEGMFPQTRKENIAANLPAVLYALGTAGLADKAIVLVALATIRAETESFVPIAEGVSRFNTTPGGPPFGLYDHRADLGNQGSGDGFAFRGRGFVQLTGRANYQRYARELGVDLVALPDRAADPATAAAILVRFLADKEHAIRAALAAGNLAAVRRLVNGGNNGLDRFVDAYQRGDRLIEA